MGLWKPVSLVLVRAFSLSFRLASSEEEEEEEEEEEDEAVGIPNLILHPGLTLGGHSMLNFLAPRITENFSPGTAPWGTLGG